MNCRWSSIPITVSATESITGIVPSRWNLKSVLSAPPKPVNTIKSSVALSIVSAFLNSRSPSFWTANLKAPAADATNIF